MKQVILFALLGIFVASASLRIEPHIHIGKEAEIEQFGIKEVGKVASVVGKVADVVVEVAKHLDHHEIEALTIPVHIHIGKELEAVKLPTHNVFRPNFTHNRSNNTNRSHHNRSNKTHNKSHHNGSCRNSSNSSEVEDVSISIVPHIHIGKEAEVEQFGIKEVGKVASVVGKVADVVSEVAKHLDHKEVENFVPFFPIGSREVEALKFEPHIHIGKEAEVEQFGIKEVGKVASVVGKVADVVSEVAKHLDHKEVENFVPFFPVGSKEVEDVSISIVPHIHIGKEAEVEQFGIKEIGKVASVVGKVAGVVSEVANHLDHHEFLSF